MLHWLNTLWAKCHSAHKVGFRLKVMLVMYGCIWAYLSLVLGRVNECFNLFI
jgi:hypothetical protein